MIRRAFTMRLKPHALAEYKHHIIPFQVPDIEIVSDRRRTLS